MFASIYYKPSLFNAHTMILIVHIFMNVNKPCLNQEWGWGLGVGGGGWGGGGGVEEDAYDDDGSCDENDDAKP